MSATILFLLVGGLVLVLALIATTSRMNDRHNDDKQEGN